MKARRFIALFLLLATGLSARAAGPDGLAPAANVTASDKVGFEQIIGAQVPLDIPFRDEKEQPITLRQAIDGKPTILALVYYRCPRLCTEVLNHLLDATKAMPPDFTAGQKYNIVCVSFDPKEHGDLASEKKKHYVQFYGRDNADWRFLTGSKESIAELTKTVGFKYEFDKAFKEYNHPSGIIVLTPEGKTSTYFLGLGYKDAYPLKDDPKATRTLRMSLVEASDGKLGSVLDKIWLACYRFDHSTHQYSPYVMGIVRIAGLITMAAIAVTVFVFLRIDRRKRANAALKELASAQPVDGHSGGTT